MSELIFAAQAPSNIALIKYMGKKDSIRNIPENPSLSLTLQSLCTIAEMVVTSRGSGNLKWIPEAPKHIKSPHQNFQLQVPDLNELGVSKILKHFQRVQAKVPHIFSEFGIEYSNFHLNSSDFYLRTANTFPASSGIASSASSFAAMTLVMSAFLAKDLNQFRMKWDSDSGFRQAIAKVSREGSGSSCRSLEGPWVHWDEENVESLSSCRLPTLSHFVLLIKSDPKKVSSSLAHQLVKTSPLWNGRTSRARSRTELLKAAIQDGNLSKVSQIAWAEAWEMHSLFHTCESPFSYWEPGTIEVLQWLNTKLDGPNPPIVTLDAGPNIHIMVDQSLQANWKNQLKERFPNFLILEDQQGKGAEIKDVR